MPRLQKLHAEAVTSFSAFMTPLLGGGQVAGLVGPHTPLLVDLGQGEEAAQQVLHHARLFSGPFQHHPMLTGNLKARAPHRHVGKGSHAMLLGKDSRVWKWRGVVEDFKVSIDHARMQSSRRPGLVVNATLFLRSVRHLQSRRDALARFQGTDLSSNIIPERLRAGEVGHAAVASVPGAAPSGLLRVRQAKAPRARESIQVVDQHKVEVVQEQQDRHLSVTLVRRRADWRKVLEVFICPGDGRPLVHVDLQQTLVDLLEPVDVANGNRRVFRERAEVDHTSFHLNINRWQSALSF